MLNAHTKNTRCTRGNPTAFYNLRGLPGGHPPVVRADKPASQLQSPYLYLCKDLGSFTPHPCLRSYTALWINPSFGCLAAESSVPHDATSACCSLTRAILFHQRPLSASSGLEQLTFISIIQPQLCFTPKWGWCAHVLPLCTSCYLSISQPGGFFHFGQQILFFSPASALKLLKSIDYFEKSIRLRPLIAPFPHFLLHLGWVEALTAF